MITPAELKEMRARADAATPGPWDGISIVSGAKDVVPLLINVKCNHHSEPKSCLTFVCIPKERDFCNLLSEADGTITFINHSITDIPRLLDEVERLRGALKFYAEIKEYEPITGELARRALGLEGK